MYKKLIHRALWLAMLVVLMPSARATEPAVDPNTLSIAQIEAAMNGEKKPWIICDDRSCRPDSKIRKNWEDVLAKKKREASAPVNRPAVAPVTPPIPAPTPAVVADPAPPVVGHAPVISSPPPVHSLSELFPPVNEPTPARPVAVPELSLEQKLESSDFYDAAQELTAASASDASGTGEGFREAAFKLAQKMPLTKIRQLRSIDQFPEDEVSRRLNLNAVQLAALKGTAERLGLPDTALLHLIATSPELREREEAKVELTRRLKSGQLAAPSPVLELGHLHRLEKTLNEQKLLAAKDLKTLANSQGAAFNSFRHEPEHLQRVEEKIRARLAEAGISSYERDYLQHLLMGAIVARTGKKDLDWNDPALKNLDRSAAENYLSDFEAQYSRYGKAGAVWRATIEKSVGIKEGKLTLATDADAVNFKKTREMFSADAIMHYALGLYRQKNAKSKDLAMKVWHYYIGPNFVLKSDVLAPREAVAVLKGERSASFDLDSTAKNYAALFDAIGVDGAHLTVSEKK